MKHIKMILVDTKMLTTNLDLAGYKSVGINVKVVEDYQKLIKLLSEEMFDIIMINLDYEKINGIELCKYLKNNEDTKHIPIVLFSIKSSKYKPSIGAGADLFVEQPIPRPYMIEKIKKLLMQQTRSSNRINLNLMINIEFENKHYKLQIEDISLSGALIISTLDIPLFSNVKISFNLPKYKKPIRIMGKIVRTMIIREDENKTYTGIGIAFEEFIGDSQKRLAKYLSTMSKYDKKIIYYL